MIGDCATEASDQARPPKRQRDYDSKKSERFRVRRFRVHGHGMGKHVRKGPVLGSIPNGIAPCKSK